MEPGPQDAPPILARPVLPPYAPPLIAPAPPQSPLLLTEIPPRAAGWDAFLVLMICVAGPYLPRFALELMLPQESVGLDKVGIAIVVLKWAELLVAAAIVIYLANRAGVRPASLGIRGSELGKQLLWGLAGLAAAYGYMLVTVLFVLAMPSGVQEALGGDLQDRMKFVDAMPLNDLALTLALLIPVAVHEELVFRALLVPLLRRGSGSWVIAVVVSAAVFGSLHIAQGMFAIVQITGLGAIFAVIFIRSRSVLAVSVAHFLFNFGQFQLMRLAPFLQQLRDAAESQPG